MNVSDYFGWASDYLDNDVSLDFFKTTHDIYQIDWDTAVWWNESLAEMTRAWAADSSGGLDLPDEVFTMVNDPLMVDEFFRHLGSRIPRTELRCVKYIEAVIDHVVKTNIDVKGDPWMIYDARRGVWRSFGQTLDNGKTVGSTVDTIVEEFALAMGRATDALYELLRTVEPTPGSPRWDWLEASFKEGAAMARSIPRGKYAPIKTRLKERLATAQTSWDSETKWLVLRDGVIDLDEVRRTRTKSLYPFHPETMSTMALDVGLDDDVRNAGESEWVRGVKKVLPDDDVRSYLQKRFGGALIGRPAEVDKSMVWQHGLPDTAKSTIQECIAGANGVFAPYSYAAASEVLMKRGSSVNSAGERFRAYARGKRFVIMSEINAGDKLDRSQFTALTGGDTVEGTAKFANAVSYKFTATLFMASNDAPTYPPGDTTFAQRIHVVPFRHKLWQRTKNPDEWERAGEEHRADPQWQRRVLDSPQERAAILHWVLDGLILWASEGLSELPEQMRVAHEEFSEGADPIKELVESLLGLNPDYPALLRIYTDQEWHDYGYVNAHGMTKKSVMLLVNRRAQEMELVKFGDTRLSPSYENAAKKMLDESGGAWKVAKLEDGRTARLFTRLQPVQMAVSF